MNINKRTAVSIVRKVWVSSRFMENDKEFYGNNAEYFQEEVFFMLGIDKSQKLPRIECIKNAIRWAECAKETFQDSACRWILSGQIEQAKESAKLGRLYEYLAIELEKLNNRG